MECTVDIEEGISIPLSKINALRRVTLQELEECQKKSQKKSQIRKRYAFTTIR